MVAHSGLLLSKCAQFREQDEFIDVWLKVGEDVFSAHRVMLAASSDYFHAMFAHGMKEANEDVIELKDESISAAALKIVLDVRSSPSTVEVLMSTIKTFLKFFLRPITFKLLVLFNTVAVTCKPSLRSVRLTCKRILSNLNTC